MRDGTGRKEGNNMRDRMMNGRKSGAGRRTTAAAVCLLAALLCAGCGAGDGAMSEISSSKNMYSGGSMSPGTANGSYDGSFESMGAGTDSWEPSSGGEVKNNVDAAVDTDRKLIRTVSLSAETREFEQAMTTLETQVRQLGGYIEKLETYNGSRYSSSNSVKYSNMTIRIPKANLNYFLETVSGVCNVTRKNEDLQDVTLSYVDIESRRDTLRAEQERLLSFLERAETVEEIIALEERISEVRYQLESMEAKLRTIDNQVDFATVNLNLSEVQELTPVEEPTAWERLAGGFMNNLGDIGVGLMNFGIWFVVNIPYFVIWAIIITIAVFVIRRSRRHHKEKLLAQAAKADAQWKTAASGRSVNGTGAPMQSQPVGGTGASVQSQPAGGTGAPVQSRPVGEFSAANNAGQGTNNT